MIRMIRTLSIAIALSTCLIYINACQNQGEKTVHELEALVTDIKEKGDNISEKEWEEYDATLKLIEQQYADTEGGMTEEQKEKYNEALGRYSGIRLKSGLKNAVEDLQEGIENAGQQMQGMLEELVDTLSTEE